MLMFLSSSPAVIWSYRGSARGLVLEVGETVQILEKCEGKNQKRDRADARVFLTLAFWPSCSLRLE